MKKYLTVLPMGVISLITLIGCTGRTADNMTPNGETIEVVIPDSPDSLSNLSIPPQVQVEESMSIQSSGDSIITIN